MPLTYRCNIPYQHLPDAWSAILKPRINTNYWSGYRLVVKVENGWALLVVFSVTGIIYSAYSYMFSSHLFFMCGIVQMLIANFGMLADLNRWADCSAFYVFLLENWTKSTKNLLEFACFKKVPACTDGKIILSNKRDVFIPDDLLLKDCLTSFLRVILHLVSSCDCEPTLHVKGEV